MEGNNDSNHIYQKVKVVFLGEQSVGKTSLVTRFMYDSYDTSYQATIGIDFLTKTMSTNERTVKLQLWDTAGQERFRSLIPSYIRDSGVAVIVYDITDSRTFGQIDKWVGDVRAQRGEDVVILLIGNKIDLNDKRQVSAIEGEARAKDLKVLYMETSAKTGFNVKQVFRKMINNLPNNTNDSKLQKEVEIKLNNSNDIIVSPSSQCSYC